MWGSCKTENLGAEKIIINTISNSNIRYVLLCGNESKGHLAGQTLIALHKNGIDDDGRIIGSDGAIPFVENIGKDAIERFQKQVTIIDRIGLTDIDEIYNIVDEYCSKDGSYCEDPFVVEVVAKRKTVPTDMVGCSMFCFQKEQNIVNIAGVKLGGQPGELPTVLAGTIFYEGHKIVEDADAGIFDRFAAEDLVNVQDLMSDETGNPSIVHIFANTVESMQKYIDFVSSVTDSPFIIDSPQPEVRMASAEYVTDIGLADKTIYNSINMSITEVECEALRLSDIDSSIVLGFNAMDSSLEGRMSLLEDGGKLLDKGLIEVAEDCGINNILIDPSITPMGNGAGIALRMTMAAKEKWGFPVGSGIHNAPSSWRWLKEKKKLDPLVYRMCDIGTVTMQQLVGGDFVLYGPIENATYSFPMAAMADIMIAEASSDMVSQTASNHPLNRLI